ncbi:MAG TPA: Hsp20/alpha crystallin family protein [Acetobacteraceae bacterium]|nr:Hsp20/alpha crystallin family protein [Acetobacteraceae bacterium]
MLNPRVPAAPSYNPIRQMLRAQADLNRMFGNMRFYVPPEFPLLNLWASPDGAIVKAEVPGVSPEDLEITIRRDTITLRGNRKDEPSNDQVVRLRQERLHGPFARNVVLPFRVDADKASAKFERGVVTLTLPRPEEDKPHRINVARA